MDSGNSGSLQSSSGGDDEYDSRAATDSFFITSHPPPPPPAMFDPLPNYMQLLNPTISWPRPASIRSDPNPSNTINPILSTSPAFHNPTAADGENNNQLSAATAAPRPAARNPKKRSRASRRAPTTVLTTDTTNFRAMVQEFTGIPSPPDYFPRTRLDLFTTRSNPPPPYLRRPFPQKNNTQSPPSFLVPSSSTANDVVPLSTTYQNPLLTSLLQSNPKFQGFEMPSSNDIKIGPGFDAFGLPNLISPDQIAAAQNDRNDENNEDQRWRNNRLPRNGEMNYSATSSSGREGIVESWICSSE